MPATSPAWVIFQSETWVSLQSDTTPENAPCQLPASIELLEGSLDMRAGHRWRWSTSRQSGDRCGLRTRGDRSGRVASPHRRAHWAGVPRSFGLEYVPPSARSRFVRHLLEFTVAPGGRLIVGPHSEPAVTQ